jgi:hypothetical protein
MNGKVYGYVSGLFLNPIEAVSPLTKKLPGVTVNVSLLIRLTQLLYLGNTDEPTGKILGAKPGR